MKLHVLTLNWNGVDKLKKLYKTLIPSLDGIDYCWYIKDNGSADGSVEFINSIISNNIKCLFVNHNRHSYADGMNILFDLTGAKDDDLILLLNNDLYFENTSSIKDMINIINNDNNVGVVGARLLYPESNRLQHAGVQFVKRYSYLPYHFRHGEISDKESEKNKEFQAVTAALLLTRAKYYKNIRSENKSGRAGLCEQYFWSFEDVDACLDIKYNQNKKIIYCGSTIVYHEESASLKKNPVNKLYMSHNVSEFKKKWEGIVKKED